MNSIAGLFPVPLRTMYSASKFAIDRFAQTIRAELQDEDITITTIYPSYVQTNVSLNAVTGDGSKFGAVDENIKSGYSTEYAVNLMIGGIYAKWTWIVICPLGYRIAVLFTHLCDFALRFMNHFKMKSQMKVQKKEK